MLVDPSFSGLVEQCNSAGIDPLTALAFAKEVTTKSNAMILALQKEYHIEAQCIVALTLIGRGGQT